MKSSEFQLARVSDQRAGVLAGPGDRRRAPRRAWSAGAAVWASMAASMTSAMAVNPSRPSRNASTATSLAAFSTTGRLPPASSAAIRQAQARETFEVRLVKLERPAARRDRATAAARPPVGIRERVLDRQPHVGDAELRDDRAVAQLDHRVHDRLRVHHHVDLIGRHAEQPVRLDDLEALVHQRRRVDRDLPPHLPRRMLQRVGGRTPCERRADWPRKRPARRGQDRAAAPRPASGRAGTGGSRCARCRPAGWPRRAPRRLGHEPPAMTSTSLLASAMVLPRVDRGQHRLERRGARRGAQHDVDVGMRGHGDEARRRRCGTAGAIQRHARCRAVRPAAATGQRDHPRPVARDLLGQQRVAFAPAARPTTREPVGMRVDDGQRARADRSGDPRMAMRFMRRRARYRITM